MAYQTGTSTGPADLVDKMRVFAAGMGWAVDFNGPRTDPGYTGRVVILRSGALSCALYTDGAAGYSSNPGPYVGAYTFRGAYNSGLNPMEQAGKSSGTASNKMAGPYQAYWLFGGPTYLHCVVELSAGLFRHIGVGVLDGAGSLTTGAYNYALRWSSYYNEIAYFDSSAHCVPWDDRGSLASTQIHADVDGASPVIMQMRQSETSDQATGGWRSTSGYGLIRPLADCGLSTLTGRAILSPLIVAGARQGGFRSILGAPRDLRLVRMDNLAPGDTITLGADTWRCFPVCRKNGVSGQESSGPYGYAYRVAP